MADWYVSSVVWNALPKFAASTAYTVGQIVQPLTAPAFNAQYAFRCTVAGTSSTEPTWPATDGATVVTGGATFANVSGESAYGWSAAAGTLYAITNNSQRVMAGDRVFLSSDHSETNAATGTVSYTFGSGNAYGVVQAISVNRAGSVPPAPGDYLAGATIIWNGATTGALNNYTSAYWQGVTFNLGGAGTGFGFGANGSKTIYLRNCAIVLSTSSTTAVVGFNANGVIAVLDNTTINFNNAGQRIANISSFAGEIRWINTTAALPGVAPTIMWNLASTVANLSTARGVDLSAVTGTLFTPGGTGYTKLLLDSCRIASGAVRMGAPTVLSNTSDELELVNCFDGTNILSERHTATGDLTTSRTTTLVGGAQDDVGLFSHQLISSTRSDNLSATFDSFWMDVENTYIGSARTATVEIISSGTLNNTDISLVLEYQGTAGSSLASFVTTLSNALTASSALPTSTATWNSPPTTPVAQHIQATFTPQQAGRVRGLVRLGKPSTTVWVNPQVLIT